MTDDPDAALVLECRAGNRRAFERLLARYERPIFNAAYRILHHREDATDVTQTVFLRAYEHFDRFDPGQRFFSWIYRSPSTRRLTWQWASLQRAGGLKRSPAIARPRRVARTTS
jgi:RNA polymerase sigma factor (sigma-70 family)